MRHLRTLLAGLAVITIFARPSPAADQAEPWTWNYENLNSVTAKLDAIAAAGPAYFDHDPVDKQGLKGWLEDTLVDLDSGRVKRQLYASVDVSKIDAIVKGMDPDQAAEITEQFDATRRMMADKAAGDLRQLILKVLPLLGD